MSQAVYPQYVPAGPGGPTGAYVMMPVRERNGLAVFGFFMAVIGLFIPTGIVAFFGLLVSLVALGRSPRTLAGMGVAIGLLGSALWLLVDLAVLAIGLVAVIGALAFSAAAFVLTQPEVVEVTSDMVNVVIAAHEYRDDRDRLPERLDDLGLGVAALTDPWGHAYEYELADADPGFELLSSGPDGVFGTPDDIALTTLDELWEDALGRFEGDMDELAGKLESLDYGQRATASEPGGDGYGDRLERYRQQARDGRR